MFFPRDYIHVVAVAVAVAVAVHIVLFLCILFNLTKAIQVIAQALKGMGRFRKLSTLFRGPESTHALPWGLGRSCLNFLLYPRRTLLSHLSSPAVNAAILIAWSDRGFAICDQQIYRSTFPHYNPPPTPVFS